MLRSALLIFSGNAFASLLLLVRNLIVARMIPVADYGVASTFAVAMAVVEMASAFGLQQQIVQAKEGDDPHFQAVLQGFQVLRGLFSGAMMALIAGPMARFMGIPEVTWAYQLLALVPVLNALVHFDMFRLNRQMVFWPMLLTGVLPALISVLLLWPLAHWFGDWQIMFYSILAQAALGAVVSHLLARRPYRLAFDRDIIRRSLRFGWPLLANAILLFLVFNAERLIVGRTLGMATLAIFSMGLTLTLNPTLVMTKSVQNFLLPQLSAAHADEVHFRHLALTTLQLVLFVGLGFSLGVLLLGVPAARLLLGAKYAALLPLLFAFALQQALRVLKAGPAIIALARGRTGNAMIANLARVCALPLCWYVATTSGNVMAILWIGAVAEGVGYLVAVWLLRDMIKLTEPAMLIPHLCVALVLACAIGWNLSMPLPGTFSDTVFSTPPGLLTWPVWLPIWLPLWVAVLAGLAACLATMPDLRAYGRGQR